MALNQQQLDALISAADPALSDADLAAQLSMPVKTPKPDRVTYATLAGVWGTSAAVAFRVKLKAMIAAGGAFGALADYITDLLAGPGIDPADSEVPVQSAAFVQAGLATQEQVDGVFYTINFPAGDVVQASDVTASRARVALAAGKAALLAWLEAAYIAAIAICDEGQRSGTLPSKAQLQMAFDPA